MKNLFYVVLVWLLPASIFAIGGFGLSGGVASFTADPSSSPLVLDTGLEVGRIEQYGFEGALAIGGYVYLDIIPFVDVDIEVNGMANVYDFSFYNDAMELLNQSPDTLQFAYVAGNQYITIKKPLLKLGIPFLAKAKLSAGAGINTHAATPIINQEMISAFVTGADGQSDLQNGTFDSAALETYLKDNLIESSGVHLQLGLQFRLLTFDAFAYYRQTIAEDVVPGKSGFGSLNFRLGLGI